MTDKLIGEYTKIGNYALPTFGAFLTASFSAVSLKNDNDIGIYLAIACSIYTMLSAFVAYWHRLLWLRHQTEQKVKGVVKKERTGLEFKQVFFFLVLHFILILVLISFMWSIIRPINY